MPYNLFTSELVRSFHQNLLLVKLRRGPLAYAVLNIIMLEFVKDFLDFWVHWVKMRVVEKRGE